jgi:phosphatidylglycerophosphate synthase
MSFFEKIKDGISSKMSRGPSHGISNNPNPGVLGFEDDMIVSKPTIIFHVTQIFFNFLAMSCFASVAAFQGKYHVGPSGLSGFALFITIFGMILSSFMLLVPVLYEKYDKFSRLARALKEVRVGFILTGTGVSFSLLIAFIVTISAWTQPGCKDAEKDPSAKEAGKEFVKGLPGWCNTKKAAAIFLWLTAVFWIASLGLLVRDWRKGKLHSPRDPPFTRPVEADDEEYDAESAYSQIPPARSTTYDHSAPYDNSESAASPFSDSHGRPASGYTPTSTQPPSFPSGPSPGRPSMDAYGAFSDPAPSGFGSGGYTPTGGVPTIPEAGPRVSRTMQYADPYAAVRASIGAPNTTTPPSYESNFQGYR